MHIRPILTALRKHRLATVLIALEIAVGCAVLCNACFLITDRLSAMHVNSGVDEASLGTIVLDGYEPDQATDLSARVLSGLRGIAGVQSVSALNSIPFGTRRGTAGLTLDAAGRHFGGVVEFYLGGPGSFSALGLRVLQGRAPAADDFQPFSGLMPLTAQVEITHALAQHLWPDASPLGKQIWLDKSRYTVVGVIDQLVRPDPSGWSSNARGWSVFVPAQPSKFLAGSYLIQAKPQDLPRVMREAKTAIVNIAPDAVLDLEDSHMLSTLRETYFRTDRAMAGLLIGVIIALLGVTALGIVGLASFWVGQRRKQIGIRRALGATRGDILRYFQIENFLIVTFGIGLGTILAYAINLLLMQQYEVPRLPFYYLPAGALALWLVGQLSVLGPALRASRVPPVVATRSV